MRQASADAWPDGDAHGFGLSHGGHVRGGGLGRRASLWIFHRGLECFAGENPFWVGVRSRLQALDAASAVSGDRLGMGRTSLG